MCLIHRWQAWGAPFRCGDSLRQNRTCATCGLVQQRRIGFVESEHREVLFAPGRHESPSRDPNNAASYYEWHNDKYEVPAGAEYHPGP